MKLFLNIILAFISALAFGQTNLTIPQIQGTGASSSYVSQIVKATGIVTAKFIGSGKAGGFFIQDPLGDNNSLSSDAVFVSTVTDNISIGDNVEITGTVSEVGGRTQLGNITKTVILSSNNALPVIKLKYDATTWNWEQYEGMLLQFDQTLYVTSNSSLLQYGQLTLNPSRRYNPTNQFLPLSAGYTSLLSTNAQPQLILDDGITTLNYSPPVFADASGSRRPGERISNLQAVVDCVNSSYVLYPAKAPVFYGNPRPTVPTELGNYNLKICAFNLEVYLYDSFGTGFGPADATQAAQQHTKILTALLAIDADVFGLIEIQQGQSALQKLVTALNTATVAGRYAYVDDGGSSYGSYTKVAFLYRADKVTPYLSLKSNDLPSSAPKYRKKAQAFTLKSNNEKFIFSINHFKAKSGCSSATGSDADQSDGQSCYNYTRVQEANSTLTFATTCKSFYGDNDVIIMGDLNAYGKEDPIQTLVSGGYVDLHRAFHADSAYSYVYNNQAGYLDNALASATMKPQVTGVSVFHINADEPEIFGYSGSAYQPTMYRSSDHDPVVVGLALGVFTSVDNLTQDDKMRISPSIVRDYFIVSNANGLKIMLYNADGRLLKQEMISSDNYQIDIGGLNLSSGVYMVKAEGVSGVKRIIVFNR